MFEFWLNDEKNNTKFLLPITPGSYEVSYGNEIETMRATALGDINLTGYRRLMSITLSSFFPGNSYDFTHASSMAVNDPMDYVKVLKKWVDNKSIIRLIIADGAITKINAQFYIENISYSEDGASNRDINYTLTLREYRPLTTKAYTTTSNTSGNNAKPQTQQKKDVKTYTVVSGDSLQKIARKIYGDASKWETIYNANKSVIGKNPNLIYPGQVYTIP